MTDPRHIETLIAEGTSALPYLKAALLRHLQEFPSCVTASNQTEQFALEAVASGVTEGHQAIVSHDPTARRKRLAGRFDYSGHMSNKWRRAKSLY